MRVLVIEDDAALNEIVCTCLAGAGYACTSAFSGSEARMLLESAAPTSDTDRPAFDLVITDLMLPGCPGEDLVPLVRRRLGNVPVIVTSAKSAVSDRVALLRTGADDYLVKPFDLDELLARIDAQLRIRGLTADGAAGVAGASASGGETSGARAVYRFGSWELDPQTRTFAVAGQPVRLTRTEFDLLAQLVAHPDRVFTKRDLYLAACHDRGLIADMVAGAASVTAADERAVTTHMGNLRAKLKATGTDGYLETVWGIGFKLRLEEGSGSSR